jgi:hypothetical protein
MSKIKDLTGKRFGRLTVISFAGCRYSKCGHKTAYWNCKCDCGNEKVAAYGNLVNGNTKSCGCYKKECIRKNFATHRKSNHRLYKIRINMIERCNKETNPAYHYYGARGIKVCKEWEDDFQVFYDWAMENGYQDNLTIERIDNDKGYSPDNCMWITQSEQMRNRRNTHFIMYKGNKITLSEAYKLTGVDRSTIRKYEKIFNGNAENGINYVLWYRSKGIKRPRNEHLEEYLNLREVN